MELLKYFSQANIRCQICMSNYVRPLFGNGFLLSFFKNMTCFLNKNNQYMTCFLNKNNQYMTCFKST